MHSRRQVMVGAATLTAIGAGAARAAGGPSAAPESAAARIAADLRRYAGSGIKAAGGPGDQAVGEWLATELSRLGFRTERQEITVPFFAPDRAELTGAGASAPVWPQPLVVQTGRTGITAPLIRADGGANATTLRGAIALVELPYGRWSSALAKPVRGPIDAALAAGALGVVVVTSGPTGKAIALNCDGRRPLFDRPVAILAPDRAAPFRALAASGGAATLTVTGRIGRRPAFNLLGKRTAPKGKWLVISTPRSGWLTCAGERGGGIAAWLELARWAAAALPGRRIAMLCNTGHEYENLGAEHALEALMPAPAETGFWLHLGANVAARDWHEGVGDLMPLPSVDPQRYLVATPALVEPARRAFAGQAGLEAVYPSTRFAFGELGNILRAGYPAVAGVFGAHRYHHVAEDDARTIVVPPVVAAVDGFKALIRAALA